jgi:hypothetical protein
MLKMRKLLYIISIGLVIPAGCCFPIPKLPALPLCSDCIYKLIENISNIANIAAVFGGVAANT